MDKVFKPGEIESRHYARWEQAGYFRAQGERRPLLIMIPPPNVTGTLHMGHAFQDTIMERYTRYHRMRGMRRSGNPAPITPASQRRWLSNAS